MYLSHNHPFPFPSKLPPNVFQVKGVKGAKENGFELRDGTFIEADAIMYCTGNFLMPLFKQREKINKRVCLI